jgi:DNA-binding HxlR family transcriptional regulator
MLTLTLRHLERDGLITRTVHPVVPPRVDYELTSLGRSLLVAVEPLVSWTREHRPTIARARVDYDRQTPAVEPPQAKRPSPMPSAMASISRPASST